MLASLLLFFRESGGGLWDSMTLRAEVLSQSPQAPCTLQYLLYKHVFFINKGQSRRRVQHLSFYSETFDTQMCFKFYSVWINFYPYTSITFSRAAKVFEKRSGHLWNLVACCIPEIATTQLINHIAVEALLTSTAYIASYCIGKYRFWLILHMFLKCIK